MHEKLCLHLETRWNDFFLNIIIRQLLFTSSSKNNIIYLKNTAKQLTEIFFS